jgi:hypothetical protein
MVSKTWYLGRSLQVLDAEIEERLPETGASFTRETLTTGSVRYKLQGCGVPDLGSFTLYTVSPSGTRMCIEEPETTPVGDLTRAVVLACQERVIEALCNVLSRPVMWGMSKPSKRKGAPRMEKRLDWEEKKKHANAIIKRIEDGRPVEIACHLEGMSETTLRRTWKRMKELQNR